MSDEERTDGAGLPEEEFAAFMQTMGKAAPLMRSLLSPNTKEHASDGERDRCASREALLCALKPYLSPSRCEAADYLLRLFAVGELLKNMTKEG